MRYGCRLCHADDIGYRIRHESSGWDITIIRRIYMAILSCLCDLPRDGISFGWYTQIIVSLPDEITNITHFHNSPWPPPRFGNTASDRKISQSFQTVWFKFRFIQTLWNLTEILIKVLLSRLSNVEKMEKLYRFVTKALSFHNGKSGCCA